MIDFQIIKVDTPEHKQMLDLRHRILRAPLNLEATREELAKDKDYTLIGAFFPSGGQLVGCCFLTHLSDSVVQLRQMAVDEFCQRRGLGSQLVAYAEQLAQEKNYSWMYLHARKTAIEFYKKLGYHIDGDYFIEVGIPHIEMMKNIDKK